MRFEEYDEALMPHQRRCLEAIEASTESLTRIHLCTGSGKTRILYRVPSLLGAKRSVFVFPTLALTEQFERGYLKKFKFFRDHVNVETGGVSVSELVEYTRRPEWCVVTTYASLAKVLDSVEEIDCLLFDEAHHAGLRGLLAGARPQDPSPNRRLGDAAKRRERLFPVPVRRCRP